MKSPMSATVRLACALAFFAGVAHGQGTQTDWSGGPGVPGPVSDLGDRFDAGDVAWGSIPGQLALRSMPHATYPQDVLFANADRPPRLAIGDVTGDGFADVILSDPLISPFDPDNLRGGVYVCELQGGGVWTRTPITEDFYGARYVDTVDMDGDGDLDVIASAFYGEIDPPPPPPSERNGRFAWFENADGAGGAWIKREIGELFWGANHVAAGDVDGDGDLDLIGCSYLTDGVYEQDADLVWFENTDGGGESWTQHDISDDFDDAFDVFPADIDADGDLDLVASGYDRFEFVENTDGVGGSWLRHTITPTIIGAGYFDLGDLDGDGDVDLIGSGINTPSLAVWLNDGTGLSWSAYIVGPFPRGYTVDLADVDGDGDLDAVAARDGSTTEGQLAWAENLGNGTTWTLRVVDVLTPSGPWTRAGDVNRDGKLDLVASFEDAYNTGVQVAAYPLTDFVGGGMLRSSILDGGAVPDWGSVSWDADVPPGTMLGIEVRGSNDPADLGPFVGVPASGTALGTLIAPSSRYVQYRTVLTSTDPEASPVVQEVRIETGEIVAVGEASAPAVMRVSTVRPNPTRAGGSLTVDLPEPGRLVLGVFDASGRRIRLRDEGVLGTGRHELIWDGRDARGLLVPTGVYFLRVRVGGEEIVRRLVRAR